MKQFVVKSVKIMFYGESGAIWVVEFFHKLVIVYGYWLDLFTISLEISSVFCFPNELRFILLKNIINITVFLCC